MLAVRNDGIWIAMSKRTIFETCYMKNISFLKTQCQARILFCKVFFAVHSSNANVPSCYSGGCCSSSGDRSSRGSSSIAATATSTDTAATSLVRLAGVHVACAARSINNDKIAFPHMDRAANVVFDSDFAWIWPGFFSETATERLWQQHWHAVEEAAGCGTWDLACCSWLWPRTLGLLASLDVQFVLFAGHHDKQLRTCPFPHPHPRRVSASQKCSPCHVFIKVELKRRQRQIGLGMAVCTLYISIYKPR